MQAARTPWAPHRYLVVEHTLDEPHGYWWAFDDAQQAWSWCLQRAASLTGSGSCDQQQVDGGLCRWTIRAPDGSGRVVEWHDRAGSTAPAADAVAGADPAAGERTSRDPELIAQIIADLALSLVDEQASDDRVVTMVELAAEGDVAAVTRARDELWRQSTAGAPAATNRARAAQLLDQVRRRMPSGS